ncbi:hypothetical protein FXO38_09633 [Capsicum annuum]|uniref:Uncharacterized protein n=1 Tax=Capsicum annuum TaxID=4072 RepID=A0A2G3AI02_CAPAN|nr:hypothetical protein FXO38_09633 [Capsicum annuum]KAF3668036.1 hypothetical protein FXO37_09736 [Capsicum annuum]PHT93818.1 hypothetical protein T459_01700 [Capsicum annuum]
MEELSIREGYLTACLYPWHGIDTLPAGVTGWTPPVQFRGILEIKLDRPGRGNAIGKEMRRGLQKAFEDVSNECSANVSMICSSVPKAFCAGADLKI